MKTNKNKFIFLIAAVATFNCSLGFAQLKVTSAGDVGIGTSSPAAKLNVAGSGVFTSVTPGTIISSPLIRGTNNYSDPANPDYTWYNNDKAGFFHPGADLIGFGTNNTERMRISNTAVYFSNGYATINSAPFIRITNNYSDPNTPDYTWFGNDKAGLFHPSFNTIGLTTNGTERLRINATGQVSIAGNPNGSNTFTVNGSAYCTSSWVSSDKRYKQNIASIDNALNKVLKLNGASYEFKTGEFKDKNFNAGKNYGFIAQEIKEVLPEVVKVDADGYYSVNYDEVIPLLVEAIKEQQKTISENKARIDDLELKSNLSGNSGLINSSSTVAKLYQNTPNPFSQSTIIKSVIPDNALNAILYIYDMQGIQVKKLIIANKGEVNSTLQASELKAGMYMYTLIIDNKEIDTKKMILTN
jgi:hypothetical protein